MEESEPNSQEKRGGNGNGIGSKFTRRLGLTVAILVLGLVVWQSIHVLLLVFAGILAALLLRTLSGWLSQLTGMPDGASVGVVLLLLIALFAGFGWMVAPKLSDQLGRLQEQIPKSVNHLEEQIRSNPMGRVLLRNVESGGLAPQSQQVLSRAKKVFKGAMDLVVGFLVIFFTGIYLAFQPGLYQRGLIRLIPIRGRARAREVLDKIGSVLRWWLLGQLISMVLVGVLTGLGLWALGVPLAFLLGVIAGLLEFVPVFGPFMAAIPAVLLALMSGSDTALYVLMLYVVIQWIESYLILPIVQRQAVRLAPVITIVAVTLAGLWFGFIGVLLGTPLAAAIMVTIQLLYVRDYLGDPEFKDIWE